MIIVSNKEIEEVFKRWYSGYEGVTVTFSTEPEKDAYEAADHFLKLLSAVQSTETN